MKAQSNMRGRQYLVALALVLGCVVALAADTLPAQLSPEQEAAAIRAAEARDRRVRGYITQEFKGEILLRPVESARRRARANGVRHSAS
jgi:hypothetical protein